MSGFGSSVVNKSGKKIAPKAAPRRRPVAQVLSQLPSSLSAPSISSRSSAEPALQVQHSNTGAAESNRRHLYPNNANPLALAPAADPTNATTATGIPIILSSSTPHDASIVTIPEPSTAPPSATQTSSPARKRSTLPTAHEEPVERPTKKQRVIARTTRSSQPTAAEKPNAENDTVAEESSIPRSGAGKKSKDNWVITTPAQITKTATTNTRPRKAKQAARKKTSSSITPALSAGPSNATPEEEVVQERVLRKTSTRIANAQKRKQKERELQSLQEPAAGTQEADLDYRPDDADDTQANEENEDSGAEGDESGHRRKRKQRRRAETPEGAAMVTIVPSMVTMSELATRERRTGMKSDRERAMAKIDWKAVKQRRKDEYYDMAMNRGRRNSPSNDDDEAGAAGENGEEADFNAEYERIAAKRKDKRRGIQVRMVNGEAVIDEQSHKVDRHAIANDDLEELEEVDDDDLTKTFNSHSYIHMKRREPAERIPSQTRWDEEATNKFYRLLSSFGTDFQIICQMFPGRTRRHIKAKFVKEEKLNPDRITAALTGGGKMDMELFKAESGKTDIDFMDPRAIEEQLRVSREERELEIEEQRLETEETNRQRKLAGDVSEPEDDDDVEIEDVVDEDVIA